MQRLRVSHFFIVLIMFLFRSTHNKVLSCNREAQKKALYLMCSCHSVLINYMYMLLVIMHKSLILV